MLAITFVVALVLPFVAIPFFIVLVWRHYRYCTTGAAFLNSLARNPQDRASSPAQPMERARFWLIIERTISHQAGHADQKATLRTELDRLTADEIVSFNATFDELLAETYSWDLWGAAYVANGGASDNAFDYFRAWLISKGQKVFEAVVNEPDSLADVVASNRGSLDFEDFAYVADQAWEVKTGRDSIEMPQLDHNAYGQVPSGTPFDEEGDHLAKRYPRLWKRFGTRLVG